MKSLDAALTVHAGVKGINELKRLSDEIKATGTATDSLDKATDELQKSWKGLSTDEQTQKVKTLGDEFKRLKAISDAKITLGIDEDNKAKKQLEEVNKAYERLKLSGKLTGSELARANELHTKKVKELEEQLGKTTMSMDEMAGELGKIAGSAGGLAVVAKAAMDFETAMAGVKKVVDGTPQQMDALAGQIKQLSVELGMTAEDVAQITALGGQLGVPIAQLGEFTKMAGQMSVAFGMTADEAGNAAAKLANVFSIPITQVGELGDAINTLGNNTAAKEREIVDAMLRIGGTAKQFGLAKEEAAALSAAMISLGKAPEVAGTAINALLTKLQTAQMQGTGFAEGLKMIGTSADEMADNISKNPQEALSGFLEKLGQLDERQRSMVSVKLFGAEYADDINVLVGSLDTYNQALGLATDKTTTAGAMQKEFEANMSTTAKKMAQAKAEIMSLAINIGQHLLPVISTTAEAVGNMAGTLAELANEYPTITQLATLMGGAVVAVKALNSVLALTGGLGSKSALQVATGFLSAKSAIDATAVSAGKMNTELGKAGGQTASLAKQMTSLNGIMGALTAWTVGKSIGDWAYESSSSVRAIGDEMGRLLAYADAIFTDRTFDDVRQHFETSAESAKRLADETVNAKTATDSLTQSQDNTKTATQSQTAANTELINSVNLAKMELAGMENELAKMGMAGQKNTQDYKDLQAQIDLTKEKIKNLSSEAENQGLGEALKSDLEKAKGAFDALGLDMDEFATGINSKAKTALQGFSTVANLAEGDVNKLAMAYNAAKTQAGDNEKAQTELNGRLLEAVNGNQALAQSVKEMAQAQSQAKSATEAQKEALSALGVSMSAINAGMSQSGQKMADSLKIGIAAIKDTATSATSLKHALHTAFDSSLNAAKTVGDFNAIKRAITQTGVSAQLSAEQSQILQAGLTGGAEAAKNAKVAIEQSAKATQSEASAKDQSTKATQTNTQATKDNTNAKKQSVQAGQEITKSNEEITKSNNQASKSARSWGEIIAMQYNIARQPLEQLGATASEVSQAFNYLKQTAMTQSAATIGDLFYNIRQLGDYVAKQAEDFKKLGEEVDGATQSLNGANISMKDISQAQVILSRATATSIGGFIKLDQSRLDNLKQQIDQARNKLNDLADSAKQTADSLEGELARMQGNDAKAQELENAQKLADLEKRINEARLRGNQAEITELTRALNLQRQINSEKMRQTKSGGGLGNQTQRKDNATQSQTSLSPQAVAGAFDELIQQSEARGAQNFAEQLIGEAKRRAR